MRLLVFNFNAHRSEQRIIRQRFTGSRCVDVFRHHPVIVLISDFTVVRQRDCTELTLRVGVALLTAIRISVALQLTVRIKALSCTKAEVVKTTHFTVGHVTAGRSTLFVQCIAGTADQLVAAIGLFIAGQLAIFVELVTDALVQCATA